MSAAVVHRPNTILPKFNFLLAGGAVVLSIIAITDNVGSNTATVTKPAAVTATVQKPAVAPARGLHQGEYAVPARGLHEGEYYQVTPKVQGRLVDESRLVADVGTKVVAPAKTVNVRRLMEETIGFKVVAPAQSPGFGRRLMDDIGPVDNVQKISAAAGVCGLKISTTC